MPDRDAKSGFKSWVLVQEYTLTNTLKPEFEFSICNNASPVVFNI